MFSKQKRMSAILLSSLLLLSSISCSDSKTESSTDSASSSDNSASESTIENQYLDDLGNNLNFGGADLRFASAKEGGEIWVDIDEDDIVNPVAEAVWKRNNLVEERINVKITEPNVIHYDKFNNIVENSVQANSDDYDAYEIYARFGIGLAAEGIMKNLDNINYLDFSKDYWNENYITNLSYKNIHYWAGGSISTSYISNARVLFANLNLWNQNYPDDDLYQIVMSGEWVIDELKSRTENIYIDLNGDGQRGLDDTFGMVSDIGAGTTNCLMFAAGTSFTKYEEPGIPSLDIDSEHNFAVFDFYHDYLYNDINVYYNAEVEDIESKIFSSGRALFVNAQVGWIDDNIRNMNDNFYLIPAPKYDLTQEEYRVTQQDGFALVGVPITANPAKLDAIGAGIECMASLASTYIYPAYYETTLKDKYSRSPEAQELIDLIYDSIIADFCLGWCDTIGYMGNTTLTIFSGNIMRDSPSSVIAKNMKIYKTGLEMLFDSFEKNIED